MKIILVLAFISSAFAAPAEDTEIQRIKKSSYGPSPCVASQGPYTPVALYLAPSGSPQQQYREDEHKNEETKESARSYYDSAPMATLPSAMGFGSGSGVSYGPAPSPVPSAGSSPAQSPAFNPALSPASASPTAISAPVPAMGIFPNAKVGGCNVPLLLSCSPKVITGHLSESHAYAAYRTNEEDLKRGTRNSNKMDVGAVSHHKVSKDFPETHPGNHHLISQDYPEPNLTRVTHVQPQNE